MPDISVTQIVKTVESGEEQVREFVEENKLSEADLEKLLEGEKAAKDRRDVREYLESKIKEKKVEKQLEQFDQDLEGIEDLLEKYRIEEEKTELPQEKVLKLVGSTVDDLVNHLEETTYSTEKLEELREAEELVKDRKTAKKAIDEEIKKTKLGEDAERVSEDAESLEENMEKLENDLEEFSFEIGTDDDFKQRLKQELEKLDTEEEEGLEDVAEAIEEKESEDKSEEDPVESQEPEEDTESEGPESDVEEPESPEDEESEEEALDENDTESEETDEEHEEEDETEDGAADVDESEEPVDEENEEQDELEKKKEIVEELEVDLSEEELEEVGIDELKQLRQEKERREELIEMLSDEFDEEMLRASSTSDLEKLAEDLETGEENENEGETEDEQEEEVNEEKLKEEAEEELQMLMGANAAKKDDEDGSSRFNLKEQIDKTKKRVKDVLPGSSSEGDEEKKGKMDAKSVKDLLDDYSQLDSKQASVKTAHVMKAFLERKLKIDREMTYKELSEYIAENRSTDEMIEIAETFKKLHRDQYMGDISIEDVDSFIQNSKKVADELG